MTLLLLSLSPHDQAHSQAKAEPAYSALDDDNSTTYTMSHDAYRENNITDLYEYELHRRTGYPIGLSKKI